MIKVYDRRTKQYYQEFESGKTFLNFLYNNFIGRFLLKIIINPFISKIGGLYNDCFLSKYKINKFIKKNNIKIDEFEEKDYKNFNDFFTRKIKNNKRVINNNKNEFISPADSKLLVYKITNDLVLNIKGSKYQVSDFVNSKEDLSEYKNGYCLVFRLSVDDYHRYCYPCDGSLIQNGFIKGKLHTVRSVSKKYKIYKLNQREYSILKTSQFGDIVYIEVGAVMVGKIVNYFQEKFSKGEEKGYFKLGGSTIVILVKDHVLSIDKDILEHSKKDIEVKVRYGEVIGVKYE